LKEIWTVGHSNKSYQDFLKILKVYKIEILVDVRSFPGSRKFPWFNKEYFAENLPSEDIDYTLIKNLGGRRKVKPDSHNTAWENPQFRGYADYMESPQFLEGINELITLASLFALTRNASSLAWKILSQEVYYRNLY
jgi:uncharacterized protein (DUF488 family)